MVDNTTVIMRGRRFNENLMKSRCIVKQATGKSMDNLTLVNETTFNTIYTGKTKIRVAAASAGISEREPLGQQLVFQESIASFPVSVAEEPDPEDPLASWGDTSLIMKNCIIVILENPDDPGMEGVSYRVKGEAHQTSATARRFIVEEVT